MCDVWVRILCQQLSEGFSWAIFGSPGQHFTNWYGQKLLPHVLVGASQRFPYSWNFISTERNSHIFEEVIKHIQILKLMIRFKRKKYVYWLKKSQRFISSLFYLVFLVVLGKWNVFLFRCLFYLLFPSLKNLSFRYLIWNPNTLLYSWIQEPTEIAQLLKCLPWSNLSFIPTLGCLIKKMGNGNVHL